MVFEIKIESQSIDPWNLVCRLKVQTKPVFNTSQILIDHRGTENTEIAQSSVFSLLLCVISATSATSAVKI
jgi:hypothetical protein